MRVLEMCMHVGILLNFLELEELFREKLSANLSVPDFELLQGQNWNKKNGYIETHFLLEQIKSYSIVL